MKVIENKVIRQLVNNRINWSTFPFLAMTETLTRRCCGGRTQAVRTQPDYNRIKLAISRLDATGVDRLLEILGVRAAVLFVRDVGKVQRKELKMSG